MTYRVRLELFEGPLDLLLHLVKKNEVEITDIPVATITDQYLEYMALLHEMNLDVAGEFLVMAATLIYLKSRTLLPAPEVDAEEDDEGDPRAELVTRLLEYQRFRDAALELGQRPLLNRDVFARPRGPVAEEEAAAEPGDVAVEDASLGALLDAFRQVLRRSAAPLVHEVVRERVSVRECIEHVLARLRSTGGVTFAGLFPDGAARHRMIVTFLALLELMRLGVVRVRQPEPFGELSIGLGVASVEEAWDVVRAGDPDEMPVAGEA
jgi:segregation and condensation protein A